MATPRVSLIHRQEESSNDEASENIVKFPASGLRCCAPFVISTAALALSFVASATCNFFTLENSDYFPLPAESVGLWCYTTLGGSIYSTVDAADAPPFDDKFQAARGFGTTTLILGITVWLFYCFAACCPFTPILFRCVSFLCICNTLFQGMVFLVLRSEMCWEGCALDTASYCAIAATILWFLAGLMSCIAGKPVEEVLMEEEEEVVAEDADDEERIEGDEEKSVETPEEQDRMEETGEKQANDAEEEGDENKE